MNLATATSPAPDALPPTEPVSGDVVRAKIVDITADAFVLALGDKRLHLPKVEYTIAKGQPSPRLGDEVEVFLDDDRTGAQLLASKDKADALRLWDTLMNAAKDGTVIDGEVVAAVKGGLSVDVGTRAFLPASQVNLQGPVDLRPFIGQKLRCKVASFDRKRGNIVLSRRAILEEERAVLRAATLKTLHEGDQITGTVTRFVQHGAIIDVSGVDGLVDNGDLSWGSIRHASQVLEVGQTVTAKVLKLDADKGRVSLGIKQLTEDPWSHVAKKYTVGTTLRVKVLRTAEFGAFVELEPAVEGLVHASEMSWDKRPRRPSELVHSGDEIQVQVLDVKPNERRIALGMRQLTPNPWLALRKRFKNGERIEGAVKSVTEFGVFVEVADGFDGLVHASDISWTERVKPSERFKKGDTIAAQILDIDVSNERIALGIKQLTEDPWRTATKRLTPGTKVNGRVTKLVDFGAFIELEPGIEGLCHVSELAEERIEKPADVVKVGDNLEVLVLDVDPESRRISLSLRNQPVEVESDDEPVEAKPERFGTALSDKLAKKLGVQSKD